MPIFEYECTQCDQRTEHLQLSSGAPLTACPECGGEVRKLMSAPAFQFKGSGWYVTDYANKGKGKNSDGDSSSSADGAKDRAAGANEAGESKKSKDSNSSGGAAEKTSTKESSAKTASPSD